MAKGMERAPNHWASQRTMGVLPTPPRVRLPTLITGGVDAMDGRPRRVIAAIASPHRPGVGDFRGGGPRQQRAPPRRRPLTRSRNSEGSRMTKLAMFNDEGESNSMGLILPLTGVKGPRASPWTDQDRNSSGGRARRRPGRFPSAWAASRAPQSTQVMPGWAKVQAMTNWPMVAPWRSAARAPTPPAWR